MMRKSCVLLVIPIFCYLLGPSSRQLLAQPAVLEEPYAREQIAIDLIRLAAFNGSEELSLTAFKRLVERFPSTSTSNAPGAQGGSRSGVQSSLLTSPATDPFGLTVPTARLSNNLVLASPDFLIPKLFEILQVWKAQKFDAAKVTETLQVAVLPPNKPTVVRLFTFGQAQSNQQPINVAFTTSTTTIGGTVVQRTQPVQVPAALQARALQARAQGQASPAGQGAIATVQRFRSPSVNQALGFYLVDWAANAGRLETLLPELELRAAGPEGQDANPLLVYAWRSLQRPDRAGETISKLLDAKRISGNQWEMIVQAAMQPLANDIVNKVTQQDLSAASQPIPSDVLDRLLDGAMHADVIAAAPYFQHVILRSIEADDLKELYRLVPLFIQHVQRLATANPGNYNVEGNVWNEVIAQCASRNRHYMTLKALQRVRNLPPLANANASANASAVAGEEKRRNDLRVNALVALCAHPIDKRIRFTEALVFDDPIANVDAFHFCNLPATQAPTYFRAPEWQAATKLLQANPTVDTISLLDLLLSDAQTSGKLNETVDRLFQQLSPDSADADGLARLLCEWLAMRSMLRHDELPARVLTESARLKPIDSINKWLLWSQPQIKQSLAAHYRQSTDTAMARLFNDSDKSEQTTGPTSDASSQTLKHWLNIAVSDPSNSQAYAGYGEQPKPWQVSSDHQLRSLNTSNALMLKYPLQGSYSIRFTLINSGNDWSQSAYGGIINGTFLEFRGRGQSGSRAALAAVNGRLTSSLNSSLRLNTEPTKSEPVTLECKYQDDLVVLSINGQALAKSQFTSHSYPFAGLIPLNSPAQYKDVEIVGSPQIASSVNLLDSSFSGWSARRYDRLLTNVMNLQSFDQPVAEQNLSPSHLASYTFNGNELRSERSMGSIDTKEPTLQLRNNHNCMLYARPLLEGERFEYEVWQGNDTPAGSPVIGLTALLIEDGKIRLHWLPTASDIANCGIALENRADDAAAQQLAPARLNDDQWNQVSLRIEDKRLVLTINGTDVYRRPTTNNTEFGWLSQPDQPSIRIRNAKLIGNWPQTLPSNLWEAN